MPRPPIPPPPTTPLSGPEWPARLLDLAGRLRRATRSALLEALETGNLPAVARPVSQGAGDLTFGLDLPSEEVLDEWLLESARSGPLSLLTEDRGWRHAGPGPRGRPVELDGFDHGGPRIAVDPVDGTRNLMGDLRPAWSVIALAPAGPEQPRMSELSAAVVAEIPVSTAGRYRVLAAVKGAGCRLSIGDLASGAPGPARELCADGDDRVDHGYFPFFRYRPETRPHLARLEAAFFARLAEREGADPRSQYDDQYISNAGQLVLLSLGTYRMIADLRAWLAERSELPSVTSKPYDLAGAVLCAREVGCRVVDPSGAELDFPLDARTPVSFVGYANAASEARLAPHLAAVLAQG